jgi:type I restriction enzyme M protein
MSRAKSNPLPKGEGVRSRKGEVLFIDASELGYMVNRKNRAFTYEDIAKIADTYHQWKKKPSPPTSLPQSEGKMPSPPAPLPRGEGSYKDVKGFCKSATLADIEKHNFVLTPGRYVGIPDEEDDGIAFEETMEILTKELAMQMREGLALDEEIKLQLEKVGFALEVD